MSMIWKLFPTLLNNGKVCSNFGNNLSKMNLRDLSLNFTSSNLAWIDCFMFSVKTAKKDEIVRRLEGDLSNLQETVKSYAEEVRCVDFHSCWKAGTSTLFS